MDLADWRDIALIILGLLHAIIVLVVAGIAGALWIYSRKGFNALNRLIDKKVRPTLDKLELQMLAIRDRTAQLPGNASLGAGEMPVQKKRGLSFPLPFGKKRRRFPLLPS